MKEFVKENRNRILLLFLVALLFLLWGRSVVREIHVGGATRGLTTTQARVLCAAHYGWEVEPGSETTAAVQIPEKFDDVYQRYNRLQTMCGFDLRRFRGKTVLRCTYRVRNFPYDTDAPVYVNLYIYNGEMIAGDCMTTALDGFMLPIDRRFAP